MGIKNPTPLPSEGSVVVPLPVPSMVAAVTKTASYSHQSPNGDYIPDQSMFIDYIPDQSMFIDYIPNCIVIIVFLGLGRERLLPLGQIHPSQPPASSCVSRPHFYRLPLPT